MENWKFYFYLSKEIEFEFVGVLKFLVCEFVVICFLVNKMIKFKKNEL